MHGRELCKSVPDGPAVNVTKASIAPGLCLGRLRSRASALGDADPFTSPTALSSPPLAFSPFSIASRVLDKRQRLRRAKGSRSTRGSELWSLGDRGLPCGGEFYFLRTEQPRGSGSGAGGPRWS